MDLRYDNSGVRIWITLFEGARPWAFEGLDLPSPVVDALSACITDFGRVFSLKLWIYTDSALGVVVHKVRPVWARQRVGASF
jgi:hypothetical protein